MWRAISGYDHYRCSACKHLFVHPRPAQDVLDHYYAQTEYYDGALAQESRLVAEAARRAALIARLAAGMGLRRRALDVGCATGIFLSAMHEAGWRVAGVERGAAMAARARQRVAAPVYDGLIEDLEVPNRPFDVVTAWEVIEHARDPVALLRALARNVAPGGLLALSTPRSDGIPARIMGARFPMLCPPEHLSLFSRESLARLARATGLELMHYSSFSNLSAEALASGCSRLVFGGRLIDAPAPGRLLLKVLGKAAAWIPRWVDRAGLGTEMQVVYRVPGA